MVADGSPAITARPTTHHANDGLADAGARCSRAARRVYASDRPPVDSHAAGFHFQSVSGTVLELVMVKWAMKPVCHVDVTDNVAVAAAA
jgi:hypothetical protein